MGIGLPLICLPAIASLILKGGIYAYARLSGTHSLHTRLYLGFLFSLSLQNVAELSGLYALNITGIMPHLQARLFYAATIIAFPFLFHLAISLALNEQCWARRVLPPFIYGWAIMLEVLLFLTPWLIKDFEILQYGIGNSLTRVPGPLYPLFALYAIGIFCGAVGLAAYGARKQGTPQKRLKNSMLLVAIIPMALLVLVVLTLLHFGIKWLNWSVTFPIAVTFFLAITAYATHQHRIFDIQFYIPWSKFRKRKTAFYGRIRAIIAEISGLESGSVKQALERVADTLRCSAALVGGPTPVLAADRAQNMASIPLNILRDIERIVVANEIEDARPEMYAMMKRHGVAAIVPFYPHSQNAASWLLLGDSFSEQVYTPLDFRMVEQLFDKMAELFLDKLLAMRTQLADAHRQIHTLEFRLQGVETNVATLQSKIEVLGQENLRLTREQPADTLLSAPRSAKTAITITLLGRDKTMLKRLRAWFPQVEHFVGADSASFRRCPLPDVLICHIAIDDVTGQRKLIDLMTHEARQCAILLYGDGAENFTFQYRKELLGSLVEILPAGLSDETVTRKMGALVELRKSLHALRHPDYPLAGRSPVYTAAIAEVQRIARFVDPLFIRTADIGEATAIGAYIHELSNAQGGFRVLYAEKFMKREVQALNDDAAQAELNATLGEARQGTLLIDNVCALSNETWDRLLNATSEFAETRLIAVCPASANQSPELLLKPLQPLVIELPTLRERRLDLPALIHYYTLQFNLQAGTSRYLSQADVDELMASNYPEDLAELRTTVFNHLRAKERQPMKEPELESVQLDKTLDEYVAEFEARIIEQTLKRCGGNKSKAARVLGVRPNTLHYKLERYGLLGSKN